MNRTKIDWADYTWNPVWGCRNNCPYCYARATANRWGLSFEPHWREKNFLRAMPKEPSRIFVNSMSEIAYWKREWWERVIARIKENGDQTFLFLTKTPEIYYEHFLPENCWLGVTVTAPGHFDQYQDAMRYFPNLCFISYEPMLEQVAPGLVDESIGWVILGAETGNRKERVIPPSDWIEPFLELPIPLYMKRNLPWNGPWRKEFPPECVPWRRSPDGEWRWALETARPAGEFMG